ncbi:MAG: NAD(P)-dependent alcohol dehydrogenase [Acetobacteraceae bacterium]|nr:NAD(P)-dependent alcohol dehydrogenase [Acetobacteraceae bacterium]
MKAAIHRHYGAPEVLTVEDVPMPATGPKDVLVRVHASSVTSGDARLRGMRAPPGFGLPMRLGFGIAGPRQPIPGMEFAGVVAAVGSRVTRFREGQPVCGITLRGANAEFVSVREASPIVPIPAGLSVEDAVALPFGAQAALAFLRDAARLQPGERMLVVGAAGNVGVFAVQLAKRMGAHVTGLCRAAQAPLVLGLGADAVIERRADPVAVPDATFDVVLDTAGVTRFADWRRALSPGGRHVLAVFGLAELAQMLGTRWAKGPRLRCGYAADNAEDLSHVAALAAAGQLRPVIGARYGLDDIVAAHRQVETGPKLGSTVIQVAPPG